jgi:hypothetical protein
MWPRQHWRNNWSIFPRVRSRVYRRDCSSFTSQFSMWDNRGRFVVGEELIVWIEEFKCECKTSFVRNVWSEWFNEIIIIPVLRSVAGKRLVETENHSACATVCCKWCKSAIALYCQYISVTTSECVTQLLINPIIRTRTRLISGVYHHTCHSIIGGLWYISAETHYYV